MNKINTKYMRKNRQYNNKKFHHYKRNQFDSYNYSSSYKRKKSISYNNYNYFNNEEEISFDKETKESNKAPSTKENSVEKSLKSNSRKQSLNKSNSIKEKKNENINEKESSFIIIDNNKEKICGCNGDGEVEEKKTDIIKINLTDKEIKNAFYKPKNFKENYENKKDYYYFSNYWMKEEMENTVILEITIKIEKNKIIYFKLRRFDDLFYLIKEICLKNKLNEYYHNFFVFTIFKALNSIYGIYNLKLKEEEIRYLRDLKKKYNYSY